MDKFVIRKSKESNKIVKNENKKFYKQIKLHNLKGVVVIEDMEKAKVLLERDDVESRLKIDTLEKLSQKLPSKEVLISTKLGKIVHKLCRDSNTDVANAAKRVYEEWRQNIVGKVGKPSIEVRCDLKTQQLRDKARNLIFGALKHIDTDSDSNRELNEKLSDKDSDLENSKESHLKDLESLAEYIEREVFSITNKKTSVSYKRTNRKLVFVLKFQKEIRTDVIKAKISVPKLVKTYFQE